MPGVFKIHRDASGKIYSELKAADGQTLLTGRGYSVICDAEKAAPAGAALTRNARRAVLKAVADAKPAAALLDFVGRALAGASGDDWGQFAATAVPAAVGQGA